MWVERFGLCDMRGCPLAAVVLVRWVPGQARDGSLAQGNSVPPHRPVPVSPSSGEVRT